MIEQKEVPTQTDSHPDIPYLIFSSQLLHYKSRPINFLSRYIPNLNSILWCPPEVEYCDAANEYLADQYDREIKEFYLEAREQATWTQRTRLLDEFDSLKSKPDFQEPDEFIYL